MAARAPSGAARSGYPPGGRRGPVGRAGGALALALGACGAGPEGASAEALRARFPGEGWRVATADGPSYQGWIRAAGGGVELQLVGPLVATPGPVRAELELSAEGGVEVSWLAFPLETPAGEAEAVLRIQGRSALLDLGARPGEGELWLPLEPAGPGEAARVAAAAAEGAPARRRWAEAWAAGELGIEDAEGRLVGALRLRGPAAPAEIWVADGLWSTEGWAPAARHQEGGDLLLAFPVQPTFGDDLGLVRVLVGTGEVIVPQAERPDPEDRRLRLQPGAPDDAARRAAEAAARAAADGAEAAWLREHLPLLGAGLAAAGGCRRLEDVDPAWPMMLRGYAVEVEGAPGGCAVELRPDPPQHRRRLRARWAPGAGAQVGPAEGTGG